MTKATWIWFPSDMEIWLGNRFNNRRTERGAMFPPFWKQDSHWQTVEFSTIVDLTQPETISIKAEGRYSLKFDDKLQFGEPTHWLVPAGRHTINIKVWCVASPPSLFVCGNTIVSGSHWLATCEDKIWIDENGVAHGSGLYYPSGCWPGCDDPDVLPSRFNLLKTEERQPVGISRTEEGMLVDFGMETMGYVTLHKAQGTIRLYYGESEAEALDTEHCETLDVVEQAMEGDITLQESRAFRYVYTTGCAVSVSMLYEYLPQDKAASGSFECSSDELNRIWQVSAYTLDLTTREFMMDGIKRDRWTWSGDAIQSYLMNYYLHFDSEAVKRTIRQLRGKDPVTSHVNTILDYTFYWFNSIDDYYLYSGDATFVKEMYPRMVTLMDYVLSRLSDMELAEGKPDDWVFVDWVDFPMHKRGTLCFEQMLFIRSLRCMQRCADIVGDSSHGYGAMADKVQQKTDLIFWNHDTQSYLHAVEDRNELNTQVTKFPNMFAILYGIAGEERSRQILRSVMHNPAVPAISTPYMRFYELAALCQMGEQEAVLPEILSYWGGMLKEGATSFWEKFNPEYSCDLPSLAEGASPRAPHLEMYGRPYGKSLCHAWGASPLYLLGRYYLGVQPLLPGYGSAEARGISWEARPVLAGLLWMKGDVPTPHGLVHIEATPSRLTVTAPDGIGTGMVCYMGQAKEIHAGETVVISDLC